jgi:CheY-like chemotaxis protein
MLIENDVITREIYNALLVQHGYEVLIATDLRTAWDKLQVDPPDAALFDLVLPDSHGFELLRNIRGNLQLKDLPVVVYTSMFVPGIVEEAKEAGATRVFDKAHLGASTLIGTLNECLVVGQPVA